MRDTKINLIVSFIIGGVFLIVLYGLNYIHEFIDGAGISLLISGVIFLVAGLGIAIIERKKH